MEEETEYLYHYTSLENLALILKNRTIRLNPLNKMDDLQEQRASDVENLGQYVFVSSWTSETKEDIPMWNMYTPITSGVRIGLFKNPFRRKHAMNPVIEKKIIEEDPKNFAEWSPSEWLDLDELQKRSIYCSEIHNKTILNKVQYVGDIKLLEPRINYSTEKELVLDMGKLGMYKNKYWEFQKEYRYILRFTSFPRNWNFINSKENFDEMLREILDGTGKAPFEYVDLNISENAFENMKITASPRMTPGNKILLEALVKEYNKSASVEESELLNLI